MYRHYYESVNGGEPACIDEQIPFDIPDSWEWAKLGTLCFVVSGTSYNKGDVHKEGIRILRGGNIQKELLFLQDADVYVPHSYKDEEKNIRKGDIILVASTGSLTAIGKAAYIYKNYSDVQIGAFMRIVRPYSMEYAEYMGKFFTTDNYRSHIRSLVSGTNINNIKAEHLLTLMVPVPPIEEQYRILKRLEELSPEISNYSELHQKQEEQEEYFPALLKKSILQHAIQGKLVPQDPNDEPASVLLERIAKERAKLGKKAAKSMSRIERRDRGTYEIFPDGSEVDISKEIPFDIPESWAWCRLGAIASKLTDGSHNPPPKKSSGYRVISAQNIRNGKIEFFESDRFADQQGFEKENPRTNIKFGDVILGIIGGSIGNTAIYDKNDKVIAQRSIAIIRAYISSEYLVVLLQSPLFQQSFLRTRSGTAQGGIYLGELSQMILPVPPMREQARILMALSEILDGMPI